VAGRPPGRPPRRLSRGENQALRTWIVQGALTRYRIIAWVVGVVLLVLVLVGMPLKYIGDQDSVVAIVGPIHGFLFMVYVVLTFDLARRVKWSFGRMLLVMLAGTIPFLSFWAERKVSHSWIPAAEPALAE
jgi:integral membrane protein